MCCYICNTHASSSCSQDQMVETMVEFSSATMASEEVAELNPITNPKVARLQELLREDPIGGWNECWKDGVTPWNLGRPTPIILHLLENDSLPGGRALVPGCGTGHDVVAIAGPERYVVGLDISENATKNAQELFSSSPNANYFSFLAADFFKWQPDELFDLIFDYTFFCAINPSLRSAWAERISDLLNPNGELITLMFPIEDRVGGPPYSVSVSNYEDVLSPFGFKLASVEDNVLAIETRKGLEKIGRWKKCLDQSSCEAMVTEDHTPL